MCWFGQGKGKHVAQKRDRDDAEAVVPGSKKVKKAGGVSAAKTKKAAKGDNNSDNEGGAVPGKEEVVKTGFFSGEKFAGLPLSDGMHKALAKLEFTMTTKIQARVSAIIGCAG